jgi:hypothetical protein
VQLVSTGPTACIYVATCTRPTVRHVYSDRTRGELQVAKNNFFVVTNGNLILELWNCLQLSLLQSFAGMVAVLNIIWKILYTTYIVFNFLFFSLPLQYYKGRSLFTEKQGIVSKKS